MDDLIYILVVLGMFVLLCVCAYFQEEDKKECADNGGIVVERFMGYQCYTKEDLAKLSGK